VLILIPSLQAASQFSLIRAPPLSDRLFFPAPVLECRRVPILLVCAERRSFHDHSAHKQQHRSVFHCSLSSVVQFVSLVLNNLQRLYTKECLYVITGLLACVIRMVPNAMHRTFNCRDVNIVCSLVNGQEYYLDIATDH
jgi:hypothetical protein